MNSLLMNWVSTLKRNSLLLFLSTLLPILGINTSVKAAERVYLSYSVLELSVSVTALENYAKKGIIDDELAIYQQYIPAQQFQKLRGILITPVKSSPVVVSQFLSTPQGEFLLRRFTEVIQSKSPPTQPILDEMRSAFILAVAEPEGLTLLNLLRKYPANIIRIDLGRSFTIATELEKLLKTTNQAIATVTKQSNLEAITIPKPSNFSQLPDLQKPGRLKSQKYTLNYFDSARNRRLLTDIYLPQILLPAPVVVISHGLGTDSSNFQYLATHLASYGFAVVVPNHPGSESKQQAQATELVTADEFQNRPLDIKYILNQLEKSNKLDARLQGKLNLQQVGVVGHSLGGYTALALAGAKINFAQLKQDCTTEALRQTWNMSLLFQCRALELPHQSVNYNLQDNRVKAAIAINPITSSIFGKTGLSQIKTPVMIVASSNDTVAPALFEQILPFSWFSNPQKYLVTLVGGTHFSTIGEGNLGSGQIALPADVVGDVLQARRYINAFSVPFFQTYIAKQPQYVSYLHPAYAQKISSLTLGLNVVQSLSQTELSQVITGEFAHTKRLKKLPYSIAHFGFLLLNIGLSLLYVMIFW
ncbi:alpha/beta hydrolase [Nostoc sp. FACHB-280]|uniref:alpha/beta hydrolase n=1 Tax=Nostoc sp. FACHB-280 TaxID=2692839 RepID=UPI00168B7022|nr:alpha/beta hydrolase [Nostoc sp. FACHB-280]MBD2493174.1 alpha/beta hydrolase [Nostoc sp. FACHB-280]